MADRSANIDIFFRNGLKEYEVLPPSDIWQNIGPAVARKHLPVNYLRVALLAGVILSGALIYYLIYSNSSSLFTGDALSMNQDVMPEGNYISPSEPVNGSPVIISAQPVLIDDTVENADMDEGEILPGMYRLAQPSLFSSFVSQTESEINREVQLDEANNNKTLSYFVPEVDGDNPGNDIPRAAAASVKVSRWRVGAMIAPTYYSSLDFGKEPAASELMSTEKPAFSYSGGLSFGYKLAKRFVLQTGVYYSSVEQKIEGIAAFSGFSQYNESKGSAFTVRTTNGPISIGNNDLYVMNSDAVDKVATAYTADVFDPFKSELDYISNTIVQDINFVEIPLILRFRLIDRRLGINLVGGISYNLLVGNSAYSYAGGSKYYVGKTEGLSPISFTSSLGMGMEYSISDRLLLNLEPTFRYFVTPLGDLSGSSVHPYSLGILSGISYKF